MSGTTHHEAFRIALAIAGITALFAAGPARAASTVRLPGTACPHSDFLFADAFEPQPPVPHDPSNGSGGPYPGDVTRSVVVSGLGTRTYYLHVPTGYDPAQALPLVLALRGAAPPSSMAAAAQQVRANWSALADAHGFLVLAPVGNSTQGGWGVSGDAAEIGAALDDAAAHYNIERSRVYLWGFSAGAHFGHTLALNKTDYFAAYGTSAGMLEAHACTDDGFYPPTCAALLAGTMPKIPVDIHIGTSDPLMQPPYTAAGDPQRFRDGGWVDGHTLFVTQFSGGHTYDTTHLAQIWNRLCSFALAAP